MPHAGRLYNRDMRKDDLERTVRQRPFQPFEVQLVDGRRFQFNSPEEFIVSRSAIHTLDKSGDVLLINLTLISTVVVHDGNGAAQGQ